MREAVDARRATQGPGRGIGQQRRAGRGQRLRCGAGDGSERGTGTGDGVVRETVREEARVTAKCRGHLSCV